MMKRVMKYLGFLCVALAIVLSFKAESAQAAGEALLKEYFKNGIEKLKPKTPMIYISDDREVVYAYVEQCDEIQKLLQDWDLSYTKNLDIGNEYCDFDLKYNITGGDVGAQFDISVDGSDWQYTKKWDDDPYDLRDTKGYSEGFGYSNTFGLSFSDNLLELTLLDSLAANNEPGILKGTYKIGKGDERNYFDLDNHTFKVRFRYWLQYNPIDEGGTEYHYTDWSDPVSFGKGGDISYEIPDEMPKPDISKPIRDQINKDAWTGDLVYVYTHFSDDVTNTKAAIMINEGINEPLCIYTEVALNDLTEKKFAEQSVSYSLSDGYRAIPLDLGKLDTSARLLIRSKIYCEVLDKASKWDYAVDQVKSLKVKKAKTTSITLTWSKVADAESYEIYDANNKLVATSKTNSVTIKKLKAATGYDYKVRAVVDKVFVGPFSDTLKCATQPKKTSISSAGLAKDTLSAKYKKQAGTGYEIQFATDKKFKKVIAKDTVKDIKTVSYSETFKDAAKYSGSTLYARVRVYFTYGDVTTYSSWSKVKSFKAK